MPRTWWGRYQLFTVLALGALAVVVVLAVTPAGPRILHSKEAALPSSSVVGHYTCDLSGYGYKGPPATIATIANTSESATAFASTGFGQLFSYSGPMNFSTTALALPPSVAAKLANLNQITLEATIPVLGAPAGSPIAKIYGSTNDSYLPTGPLTQLQVVDATETAFFSSTGTALLDFPAASLLFTPYRDYQPLPTITCAVVPGPVTPSAVTVTVPPAVPPVSATPGATAASTASGAATSTATVPPVSTPTPVSTPITTPVSTPITTPVTIPAIPAPSYACASNFRTPSYRSPLPMTVTTSGALIVGHTLRVTLSSPATGLADPAPGQATKLKFTGSLPVAGAQAVLVRLKETTVHAASPTFTVSGRLRLKTAGTDTISFPRHFVYTVYLPDQRKAVFTCGLTRSPAGAAPVRPVALTVRVARAPAAPGHPLRRARKPPVTKPPVTKPPVTKPHVTKPRVTRK